jgi:hypothetical protein
MKGGRERRRSKIGVGGEEEEERKEESGERKNRE